MNKTTRRVRVNGEKLKVKLLRKLYFPILIEKINDNYESNKQYLISII